MEKPTKSKYMDWVGQAWNAYAHLYAEQVRETIKKQYFKDALQQWNEVERMSQETFDKFVMASQIQTLIKCRASLTAMQNVIEGCDGKTLRHELRGV